MAGFPCWVQMNMGSTATMVELNEAWRISIIWPVPARVGAGDRSRYVQVFWSSEQPCASP
jgi:hypothetical protein